MIASIKDFFRQFIEPGLTQTPQTRQSRQSRQTPADDEYALQIASAALLLEMMRMDQQATDAEHNSVADSLRLQFRLDAGQLESLLTLAKQEASQATDYYQFTSLINQSCSAAQKTRIIENMWRVAMADGYLDAHETHLMRKIAGLLHVGHADYIAAKQRARQSENLPPA